MSRFADTFAFVKESTAFAQQEKETATVEQTNPPNSTSKGAPAINPLIVNQCQRGNEVLHYIRLVPWAYGETIADYQVGQTSAALFLSLHYHRLRSDYIDGRIQQIGKQFKLRILLCLIDVKDPEVTLRELTKLSLVYNFTLIIAWSPEEAGRYLETFKSFEHKPVDMICERIEGDYLSQLTEFLTQIKGVNKTDVITLITHFKSLKRIAQASVEALSKCPGIGPSKAQRLYDTFRQPFH